jgi:hypothetical protein
VDQEHASQSPRASQFRIGLLVDSVNASKYVYEFAEWAQTQNNILAVTHLVLHPPKHASVGNPNNLLGKLLESLKNDGLYRTLSKALFKLIVEAENVLLGKQKRHKNHLDIFDLTQLVPDQIVIDPIVSKSGFVYRFSLDDIKALKNLDLDLLIRCGSGILRGDILEAARLGIISVHHADNRTNRGGPAGFWEVYFRQDTTGFTIQRLTEELDGGDVLMRGHFQTLYYYLFNQAALYERSNHYLKLFVRKIAFAGGLPDVLPAAPYSNELFRAPTAYQACIYLMRLSRRLITKKFKQAAGIHYRWHVAFTHGDWRSAVLWRGTQIENAPSHFLADPFVISKSGKDFCFVEDLDFQTMRGKIAVYELTRGGGIRIGTALEEAFHLSFPYIFEYQDELYMCPETSENRDIRIYKCVEFPLRWKLEHVAMKSIAASDTMLFEKDGKWWMFTNIDPVEGGDYNSELSVFYSDSPFGKWSSHALNPIYVDAARARNAGLIKDNGTYFRMSQGQGFDMYGKQMLINEIVELTDSNYAEITKSIITSAFANGAVGTHHLHSNGNVTVFDFVTSSRVSR